MWGSAIWEEIQTLNKLHNIGVCMCVPICVIFTEPQEVTSAHHLSASLVSMQQLIYCSNQVWCLMNLHSYANTHLTWPLYLEHMHTHFCWCDLISLQWGMVRCSMPSGASDRMTVGFGAFAKSQPDCPPGGLALRQAVFTATSGRKRSDYHTEYTQLINQQGGRQQEADTENECGVWIGVVVLLVLLYLQHTEMWLKSHTRRHPRSFLAGDVGPESRLMFQFQSLSLARSNAQGSNWRWCHYPTAVSTTQRFTPTLCMCGWKAPPRSDLSLSPTL